MAAQIGRTGGNRNHVVLPNRNASPTSGANIGLRRLVGLNETGHGVRGYGRIPKGSGALQFGLAGALWTGLGSFGLLRRFGSLPVSLWHQPKKAHTINATTAAEPTAT